MKLGITGLAAVVFIALANPGSAATCSFKLSALPFSFGNLDPGIGADVVVTSQWLVRCTHPGPPTDIFNIDISDDDGLHKTGANANRMINTSCPVGVAYLPYSLEYTTPLSGRKSIDIPINFTGTIMGSLFQDACIGLYTDTVTITVSP